MYYFSVFYYLLLTVHFTLIYKYFEDLMRYMILSAQ